MEQVEQRLGNYRLLQVLGTGAFATVYLGEHLYLNTPVAIKVLRAQVDESTLANFLTEARHVSRLVHPHIIRVFDFGLEAQVPFLVMDYAPFGNLRQLHSPGTVVPFPTIVSYVRALASALQHAHDQHLIHRDLKPENVLLGPKHEVLLSDFGLALLASGTESMQVRGQFGTLAYMAPEQILGQPSPASDQYALAVMIYEWLCGQLPFVGSAARISNQHLYTAPEPLCERYPTIPLAVEQVVFKGLSKEPSQRFVDVLSFATALTEACQVAPAVSPPSQLLAFPAASPLEGRLPLEGQHRRFRNVPVALTPLIGREQELHATRDLLLRPEVRLLTLTGPGGIGKTHLALCLTNEVLEAFALGCCFVSLAAIDDPEQVIPAIIEALGLPVREDGCPPLAHLKTFLRDQQLVMLLDTFEQVLPAAPLLAELLSSCPQLKLLVTSRALLHVGGEYEFPIPPLEVPDLRDLPAYDDLSHIAAVALYMQRTQAVLPGFQLTVENAHAIAELCTRLEGVPLAIELAAARSKVLPPQALLGRLEPRFQVLTGGRRDAPPRQQTLHKTLGWTYDVLSPEEQTLFRRLSVFVGGCSLHAAEAMAAALGGITISVLDGVASLLDKSLLRPPTSRQEAPRLSPFEMMRGYGLERLEASGELEQACDAHAAYYLAFAEEVESILLVADQVVWQERLEPEQENLRAALWWLLERHEGEAALRMAAALRQFWVLADAVSEGRIALEQALEVCKENQPAVSLAVRAKALYAAGWLAYWRHDPVHATPLLEDSLELYHSLEDTQGAQDALTCLNALQRDRDDSDTATAQSKEGTRDTRKRGEIAEFAESGVREGKEADTRPTFRSERPSLSPMRLTALPAPFMYEALTAREGEVLQLLAMGISNSQIAERLVVSRHTINGHVQSIYGKLGINSRSAATLML
ncbi:MAG: hypothetical protein E6J22_12435 [Chloroflexi bacterium]|nr:MAG: hypothetical protein E6J22_12435 [Chloroflexota bacterium]